MTADPPQTHQALATPDALDDLANLRAGLYGPAAEVGPGRLVEIVVPAAGAAEGDRVLLVDGESVPVAEARLGQRAPSGAGARHVVGPLQWRRPPSPRPFQPRQLRSPDRTGLPDPVTVVEESWQPDPGDGPEHDLPGSVLVLASTSLDGPTLGNDTVRQWCSPGRRRGRPLAVVPLSVRSPRYAEKRAAVLRALALADPATGTGTAAPAPVPGAQAPSSAGTTIAAGVAHPAGRGLVVFFTGLSGSGKSTLARALSMHLIEQGRAVTLLDGDRVRHHLSKGLSFSAADRETNIRRIGWVAAEIAHHGGVAVCSPIAPSAAIREEVRQMVRDRGGRFRLVHVATPLGECERRDRKGLYAKARRGEIPDFTGISARYDVPVAPDLRIDTTGRSVEQALGAVLALVDEHGSVHSAT